eukprot:6201239-Pleurochrysis_carterae.AAC.2
MGTPLHAMLGVRLCLLEQASFATELADESCSPSKAHHQKSASVCAIVIFIEVEATRRLVPCKKLHAKRYCWTGVASSEQMIERRGISIMRIYTCVSTRRFQQIVYVALPWLFTRSWMLHMAVWKQRGTTHPGGAFARACRTESFSSSAVRSLFIAARTTQHATRGCEN